MKTALPTWFKQKLPSPEVLASMGSLFEALNLHTICQSALCPNIGECFISQTATFLILGDICTRHCSFCAVKKGQPVPVDEMEPQHLLEAVERLGLTYLVITSVTRDDLLDGGASQFVMTITLFHEKRQGTVIEVLIPDFLGSPQALKAVIKARPQVMNHNVETVPRLYSQVRPEADYSRSLQLLLDAKKLAPDIVTKSGLMLGLGETKAEVIGVMRDLRDAKCDLLTIGQYLQSSSCQHPVISFVTPDMFSEYEKIATELGFGGVASAPLVRSSYKAVELYNKAKARHF